MILKEERERKRREKQQLKAQQQSQGLNYSTPQIPDTNTQVITHIDLLARIAACGGLPLGFECQPADSLLGWYQQCVSNSISNPNQIWQQSEFLHQVHDMLL
jgi:hypothetical protein